MGSDDEDIRQCIWDFWHTDFDPDFWPHLFRGDDLGKELSLGPVPSIVLSTSWLSYHGTTFHSAVTAICSNGLCRGEKERGAAHANDLVAKQKEAERPVGFETTMGRGVYSAQQWHKA